MTPTLRSLSVFYPCQDEAESIAGLIGDTVRTLDPIIEDLEIIVVDDGSTDDTAAVITRLSEEDDRVRLVRHERNLGYGMALRSGFAAATKDWVFFTDGDGQFHMSEFPEFAAELERADAVVGFRRNRQDHWIRRMNGEAWNILVRLLFGLRVRDVDCAYKLLPRPAVQEIELDTTGNMISTELLVKLFHRGLRIVERGVTHRPRMAGRATGNHPLVVLTAFREVLAFRLRYRGRRRRERGRQP